jgi:hypothetical protein
MAAGCPVVPGVATQAPATEAQCAAFIQQSIAEIEKTARTGDVLFLPGLRTQRYREYWEDAIEERKPPNTYTDSMIQYEAERLRPLLDRGMTVLFEEPKPVYNFAPLRCSDWFNRGNPHCRVQVISRDEALAWRAPVVAVLHRIVAADPRILLWDPFPVLCAEGMRTCAPYLDGCPLVTDGDHLSAYANDLLTPDFETRLMKK